MLQSFLNPQEFHKHLLIIDSYAAADPFIQNFAQSLMNAGKPFELHVTDSQNPELLQILERQKMSTFLSIAGLAYEADTIRAAAVSAGFTETEMQVIRFGKDAKRLFCAGCQSIFQITAECEVECTECGLRLSVTDHYSPNLAAYLGYPEI